MSASVKGTVLSGGLFFHILIKMQWFVKAPFIIIITLDVHTFLNISNYNATKLLVLVYIIMIY